MVGVVSHLIPEVGRQRQVDLSEFKARQGYIVRPFLKKKLVRGFGE